MGMLNGTYHSHRKVLAKRLPDGLILVAGGTPVARNHDVDFVFRQRSDFLYLTGVEDAGCFLLIDPRRGKETLFIPRIDNHHRVWLGHVPGPAEAGSLHGFKRVLYSDELPAELRRARRDYRRVYADPVSWKRASESLKGRRNSPAELRDALDELRAVKTDGEIALMRQASAVSSLAHRAVMQRVRPGLHEYELQAVFESECLSRGLRHLGYPTIAAAGANAAVLHYMNNRAKLAAGELFLIDAGAEVKGYCADITRTYPANGRFTRRQRDIYQIVLETQKACIDRARVGVNSADLHVHSMTLIAEGLKSLGILQGDTAGLVEGGAVRLFYPHGLTHMLGLDVHDVTGGRKRRMKNPNKVPVRFVAKLEPGFAVTMEPGIYFIPALLRDGAMRGKHRGSIRFGLAEKFLDFGGVRIEDDVVVRRSGPPLNLTDVPKEIADIERLIQGHHLGN